MVDTGAAPNIVKVRNINSDTLIQMNNILYLSGITNGRIKTLGSIQVFVGGHSVTMHVVPNDFPIVQEGILGSDFLWGAANINLTDSQVEWKGLVFPFIANEKITIPARSKATFYLRVLNGLATGYVPPLSVCEGVIIGNAIVTNKGGRAYLHAINTTEEEKEIAVPCVRLQEVESYSRKNPISLEPTGSANSEVLINTIQSVSQEERIKGIKETLRLNHLNKEEAEHVDKNNIELLDETSSSRENILISSDNDSTSDENISNVDDDSDGEDAIYTAPNVPYDLNKSSQVRTNVTKENLLSCKDNLVVFISQRGTPCDEGANILRQNGLLQDVRDTMVGRARPHPYKKKKIITLTIKNKVSELIQRETIEESIHSLLDVVTELDLESFTISKCDIDNVPFDYTFDKLKQIFQHTPVSITVCENFIRTPMPDERKDIIAENHSSAIGGHKGITKTYKRIRGNYF
ncbi:hypothetical protein ALC62_08648 [Cyphomyrmex costatus]|uniref:Integrase zinc-binding domain-containing protein n=1 Tax=Cyphomyrmex costatus TaxID=456900 RepID=A0A151IGM5_9HYME|nr:hypothetical protein ALC62_08648 [Cyphomyrmex costatus]